MTRWPLVPLWEILERRKDEIDVQEHLEYGRLTIRMNGNGIHLRDRVLGNKIGTKRQFVAKAGQLVLSKIDARNGAFGILPSHCDLAIITGNFWAFEMNDSRLDSRFFEYFTKTGDFLDFCIRASEGTTNRRYLQEPQFLRFCVPLPPIEEQRRLVGRIEGLERKVRCISDIAADVEVAEHKMWMILAHQRFRRLSNGNITPLAELVTLLGGGTPSKGNPDYWHGQIPWVSPKDMKTRIIRDSADHISDSAVEGSAAKLIHPGAVLIVVRGMILAHTVPSAVLAVPATINQDMKALVPTSRLDPEFLSMYLWAFNQELLALVEKSTHDTRKLETHKLLRFPVIVPPMDTQKAICAELRNLEEQVAVVAGQRRIAHVKVEALLPSILNQAFDGRL